MAPTIAWHNYNVINIQAKNYDNESNDVAWMADAANATEKALEGFADGLGEAIAVGLLVTLGIVALIVAIPIIIYNIGEKMAYSDNPLHNEESIQVKISPTMNLDNPSAGINAIFLF